MQSLPANSTVHILAGKYQTDGNYGWNVKTGQKILGSGIDVTVLQVKPDAISGAAVIQSYYANTVSNVEVADLTCDCNPTGRTANYYKNGVEIDGSCNAIRRVKVINTVAFSSGYTEVWGIVIDAKHVQGRGNIIEDCEVTRFSGSPGNNLSAIYLCGMPSENFELSSECRGVIRNCRVLGNPGDQASNEHMIFAYGGGQNCLIEGNYAENVYIGSHDEYGADNMIFINNIFKNCSAPIDFHCSKKYSNMTIAYNHFELASAPGGWSCAIYLNSGPGDQGAYTNVNIIGNTVTCGVITTGDSSFSDHNFFLACGNVTGLNVYNNTVDARLGINPNVVVGNYNVHMDNNYDLFGNYRSDLSTPMVGGTAVTPFGINLMSSAGAASVLTAIGLPSNAGVLITNGSTTVVQIQTNLVVYGTNVANQFVGNGSGLTNIPASAVFRTNCISYVPLENMRPSWAEGPASGLTLSTVGGTAFGSGFYGYLFPTNIYSGVCFRLSPDQICGWTNICLTATVVTTNSMTQNTFSREHRVMMNNGVCFYADQARVFQTFPAGTNVTQIVMRYKISPQATNAYSIVSWGNENSNLSGNMWLLGMKLEAY